MMYENERPRPGTRLDTVSLPDVAPINRETSPDGVARHLRALIVTGELRRGDRVPRDDIARALGVSPVPVREAIIALDREGWLRIEPHRGAFVHGVDEHWVSDHYALMGAIYALVAARASERATSDDVAALRLLAKQLAAAPDAEAFDPLNERLMRALISAARSPRLDGARRGALNIVPGNFFAEVQNSMEPQRRAMGRVVRAVAAHDAEVAAATMRELSKTTGRAVVALLEARGVLDADDGRA
jgi:DNA-binding GntR family transcriptional regulator